MVVENVVLVLMINGVWWQDVVQYVVFWLVVFGFFGMEDWWIGEFFGGQVQCVVIVRVQVIGVEVVFVDELMGVFDFCIFVEVMDVLLWFIMGQGCMFVVVMYDVDVVVCCICMIVVCDGCIFGLVVNV